MPSVYFHEIKKDVKPKYFLGGGSAKDSGPYNTKTTKLYVPEKKEFTAIKQFLLFGKNNLNADIDFDPRKISGLKVYTYMGVKEPQYVSSHQTLQVEVPEECYKILTGLICEMVNVDGGLPELPWEKA